MPVIPSKQTNAWKTLYLPGDYKVIAKRADCSSTAVGVAVSRGAASDEIINHINAFYKERAKEQISQSKDNQKSLQKILSDLN